MSLTGEIGYWGDSLNALSVHVDYSSVKGGGYTQGYRFRG